jgi:anion-transporting  ArsA/GET3 family ATPase
MKKTAKVFFLTGKGGVGKTTLASALAINLAKKNHGPVLVIDANGPARVLKNLGLPADKIQSPLPQGLETHNNLWGLRITPKTSFQEYFEKSLSWGDGFLSTMTSTLRQKIVEKVANHKVVSAFVDVCPGLEPSVLTGKIFYEATQGICADVQKPWAYIVVDAPATGHGIMMFKSPFALSEIFQNGPIGNNARQVRNFFVNPDHFEVVVVTLPTEHAFKEAQDILQEIQKLGFSQYRIFMNRMVPAIPMVSENQTSENVRQQLEFFHKEQSHQLNFKKNVVDPYIEINKLRLQEIPDFESHEKTAQLQTRKIQEKISEILNV